MSSLLLPLIVVGLYPWLRAWIAVRKTSLNHALAWACSAWVVCGLMLSDPDAGVPYRYLALCLIACAGVAVLGARRPHVGAWNFVVAGLLAVMALPLLENLVLGDRPIGPVRVIFLSTTLIVVLGNYLPTCFWPAALLAGVGCAGEMGAVLSGQDMPEAVKLGSPLAIALVPWVGWACWVLRRRATGELERRWQDFRDLFGVMWSVRVREQFNHAAEHAGWPVLLTWKGIAPRNAGSLAHLLEMEMLAVFHAVIKRFSAD